MDAALRRMIELFGDGRLEYDVDAGLLRHTTLAGGVLEHEVTAQRLCTLLQTALLVCPDHLMVRVASDARSVAALLSHLDRAVALGVPDLGEGLLRLQVMAFVDGEPGLVALDGVRDRSDRTA